MSLYMLRSVREMLQREESRELQDVFFDFLTEENRKPALFVSLVVKIAFAQIERILLCYEDARKQRGGVREGKTAMQAELPESMAKMLDDCTGYKPVVKNFIFREVLAECAKNDDMQTFRLIIGRYGNRFGIVRYIPGAHPETFMDERRISRYILDAHPETFMDEGRISRGDRTFYVTEKPEFLDLLEIEEEREEIAEAPRRETEEEAEDSGFENRCFLPLRLPDERDPNVIVEPSMKMVSGECGTGRAALLCGNDAMLLYLKERGVRFEHGITRISRSGKTIEVNLLEAALVAAINRPALAVNMSLDECTEEEKYRDAEDSIIRLLPEEELEWLFACDPRSAGHLEDSLAVTCASRAVLTAWFQAGTRSKQQKMAVLRKLLEDICKENCREKMNWNRVHDQINMTGCAIPAFLRELYRCCENSYDRNRVCRLAYLYYRNSPAYYLNSPANTLAEITDLPHSANRRAGWYIPDEDMQAYFSDVRDIAWFFCLYYADSMLYLEGAEKDLRKIREWMQWEEGRPLLIGDEIRELPVRFNRSVVEAYLCNPKTLQEVQFVSKHKEYLEAVWDTIIECEAWDCVIRAYDHGFLTIENLSSLLGRKPSVPGRLKGEIVKRMHNVSVEKELGFTNCSAEPPWT